LEYSFKDQKMNWTKSLCRLLTFFQHVINLHIVVIILILLVRKLSFQ